MTDKYNGWTNYETWNVALWLGNEQSSERHWSYAAEEAWEEAKASLAFSREQQASLDLSERLKDEIEESMPDLGASMFADLLGAAMSEVNWYEIAEHYIADVDKAVEEEETEEV